MNVGVARFINESTRVIDTVLEVDEVSAMACRFNCVSSLNL